MVKVMSFKCSYNPKTFLIQLQLLLINLLSNKEIFMPILFIERISID